MKGFKPDLNYVSFCLSEKFLAILFYLLFCFTRLDYPGISEADLAELLGVNPSLAPTVTSDSSKQELDLQITGNKAKTTPTSSNHGSGDDEKTTEEPGSEVPPLVNGTAAGDGGDENATTEPLSDLDFISSQSSQ